MKKKTCILTLFFIIIFINLVSSATVVEVPQDEPKKANPFADALSFITSGLFWLIVAILVVIVLFCVVAFFVIRWLIQYLKEREDIFFKVKKDRIKLAKIHRSFNSKHWLKIKKNTPIRFVKKIDGKLQVSKPIAYHRGDYRTHEGNFILTVNFISKKKWFLFPETDVIVIPNKEKITIIEKDEDTLIEKQIVIDKIPQAQDIIQFTENDIFVYADSFSKVGLFYIPVLRDNKGRIIDLSMPVFTTLKEVVLTDYLYEQTDEFSKLAKTSMNINPNVRAIQKVSDSNQSADIPQENQQQ